MFPTFRVAAFAVLTAFSATAAADTLTLPLTDDAHISDDVSIWLLADTNFGSAPDLFVHNYGPRSALVRFDAAAITGQSVNSATLSLYLNKIKDPGTVKIFTLTSSWNEGTVTWNLQPPAEAGPVAVVTMATADQSSVISIDVTSAVQRWADGSLPDAGFLISTSDSIRTFFDAKEKVGGNPAMLEVDTGPVPDTGEAIVLDLSNPDNCAIDEPGLYILDRSWLLTPDGDPKPPVFGCQITISADATLDFRGFEMDGGAFWPNYEPIVRIESGASAKLQNGQVSGTFVAIEGLDATVHMDSMQAYGRVSFHDATVLNSHLTGSSNEEALRINGTGLVQNSEITCTLPCISTGSEPVSIINNSISGNLFPTIVIAGSQSIIRGNRVSGSILINGSNRNIVAWNILDGAVEIDGTENILNNNIVRGRISFIRTGNFFGDNRVSPVSGDGFVGTTGQIDWGGNVEF